MSIPPAQRLARGERGPPGPRGLPGLRGPPGLISLNLVFPSLPDANLIGLRTQSVLATATFLSHPGKQRPRFLTGVVGCSIPTATCHLDIFDRTHQHCLARLEWQGEGPLAVETTDFFGPYDEPAVWQVRFGVLWSDPQFPEPEAYLYSLRIDLETVGDWL